MHMSPRTLVIDLDGTLLTPTFTISARDLEALRTARSAGLRVIIATGRPRTSVKNLLEHLGCADYFVCSNGGAVFDEKLDEPEYIFEFPPPHVARVINISRSTSTALAVYTPKNWYVEQRSSAVILEISRSGSRPTILKNISSAPRPAIKAMFISPTHEFVRVEKFLTEQLATMARWFYSYPEYLEIMPLGSGKMQALEFLFDKHGLSWGEVIAIGDGDNDVEMLKKAGTGVAMSNATANARAAASMLTGSNSESGVAQALKKILRSEDD